MALLYTDATGLKSHIEEETLAQLTDDSIDGVDEAIVDTILTQALEEAESFVDSYIGKVYDLPLTTVPSSVKLATYVVAKYNLLLRRRLIEEDVFTQYQETLNWLREVASEELILNEDATATLISAVGFADYDSDENPNTVFEENVFV